MHEELTVKEAATAAELRIGVGGVLGHAVVACVRNADEDDGLNALLLDKAVSGDVSAPGTVGKIGGLTIEEVLTVVEIEDGKGAIRISQVGGREIDGDGAIGGKSLCVAKGTEEIAGVGRELWIKDGSRDEAGSRQRCSDGMCVEQVDGRSRFQGSRSDALGWHQTSRGDGACDGSTTGGFQARWAAIWRC